MINRLHLSYDAMQLGQYVDRRFTPIRIATILAVCVVCVSSGCQFAPKPSEMNWPWSKNDTAIVPERILAVWTDTVMHQPNQPGVRGFGGRIYFYESDESDPIKVDGGLAVYAFDTESVDNAQTPLRKYVFTAEQFASHMSQTSIGPSYSVWLPWGEVGGPPQKLSLIARFQGSEGGTVISDPTIKLLPGVASVGSAGGASSEAGAQSGSHVALAGHVSPSVENPSRISSEEQVAAELLENLRKKARGVETIDLPPSFQRHLDQGATGEKDTGETDSSQNQRVSSSGTLKSSQRSADDTLSASVESDRDLPLSNSRSFFGARQASADRQSNRSTSNVGPDASTPADSYSMAPSGFTGDGSNQRSNIHEGRWIEPPRERR